MPVHRGNLSQVINNAWARATRAAADEGDRGKRNRERSQQWVCELAEEFRNEYHNKSLHRVFWHGNKDNQEQFGLNEFLFDVMVCSVSGVESLQRQSNRLDFIDQCHWQVESEFNRDNSRAIIVDMSKLVVGSAENKLFIASHRDRLAPDLLELCARIARRCSGNFYLAFVAHPEDWASDPKEPVLYEWLAGDWEPILRQS